MSAAKGGSPQTGPQISNSLTAKARQIKFSA